METQQNMEAVCRCGATALRAEGVPITVATCHCESCTKAAKQFERDLGAVSVIENSGGVEYTLFRKDRVDVIRGHTHLQEYRLSTEAPTRRVVASCCNSPLFLDFTPGHWLSLYRSSLVGRTPVPKQRAHSVRFFLKLLGSWVSMGFRRPTVSF